MTDRLGAAWMRSCNRVVAVSEGGEGAAPRLTTLSMALYGDVFSSPIRSNSQAGTHEQSILSPAVLLMEIVYLCTVYWT